MSAKTVRTGVCTGRRSGRTGVAVVIVVAALAYLAIGLVNGDPVLAVGGPAVMLAYGGVLYLWRRRSEPVALLGGNPTDERQAQIMLRASAVTAHVLAVVLVAGAMVTLALDSRYAGLFCGLCAVTGATFVAATILFSRRG